MNKLIVVLLCIALVSANFVVSADALPTEMQTDVSIETVETLIPCDATVDDNFVTGEILVGIKSAYSAVNKIWNASDFPELTGITLIEDLTYASTPQAICEYQETENFHQLLSIHIDGVLKQDVILGIELLEHNDKVLLAEPNYLSDIPIPTVQNNTLSRAYNLYPVNKDRYMVYTDDTLIDEQADIYLHNIDKVWNAFTIGSSSVSVAVLDHGIYAHEDLVDNLEYGYDFSQVDEDGNVIVDPLSQYPYYGGHGTAVASVIGARGNNGKGLSGVCQRVTIYPYIVTRTNGANSKHMAQAVLKAEVQNVQIINISYAYGAVSGNLFTLAADLYDGLIVISAGNYGEHITSTNWHAPMYDLDNVIVVGGVEQDANGSLVLWEDADGYKSNYSATYVDIMALSKDVDICMTINDYQTGRGTSYAAPLVAGVAALLLSYDNTLTAAQIKQYIMDGARTTSALSDYCVTGGYLDAYGAFMAMLQDRPYNYKVQIYQHEEAIGYYFTVNYYEDYEHLTEIVIPDIVQENLESIYIYFENDAIIVNMELTEPAVTDGSPIIEFHFISYGESTVAQTYFSKTDMSMWGEDGFSYETIPYNKLLAGDANGDNVVNMSDYLAIMQHSSGSQPLTGEDLYAADVDGDFEVGSADALAISKYITGKILSFY